MPGRGRLGSRGPAALHDRRVLRQEAPRAQDGEQEAAQTQVRVREESEVSCSGRWKAFGSQVQFTFTVFRTIPANSALAVFTWCFRSKRRVRFASFRPKTPWKNSPELNLLELSFRLKP